MSQQGLQEITKRLYSKNDNDKIGDENTFFQNCKQHVCLTVCVCVHMCAHTQLYY